MPARKNPISDEEQHRRFIEGAKELGVDTPEAQAECERALKKIARAKQKIEPPEGR
jgi:hypothetical protein